LAMESFHSPCEYRTMIDIKIVTNEWAQSVKSFTVAHVHLPNGRELVSDCRLDTH